VKKEIRLTVEGTSPLLMHNPVSMAVGKGPTRTNNVPSPEEEAEKGCYRDSDGNLVFPAIAFRNALLRAASGMKVGKKTLRSVLAHIQTSEEYVSLIDPETGEPLREYAIDMRRAVVQKQGIVRARPKLEKWGAEIGLIVETDIVPENISDILKSVLDEAGRTVGVGDYRLERGGWFGTFRVVS